MHKFCELICRILEVVFLLPRGNKRVDSFFQGSGLFQVLPSYMEEITCLKSSLMVSLLSLIVVVYNLKRGFDDYGIRAGQIESCVFDGLYLYCSIEKHLTLLYDLKTRQVLNTWDPLH